MIGEIARQLVGLFVDDELLAAGILVAVGIIALLTAFGGIPEWAAGLLLAAFLPAALVASVLMSAWRARQAGPKA